MAREASGTVPPGQARFVPTSGDLPCLVESRFQAAIR